MSRFFACTGLINLAENVCVCVFASVGRCSLLILFEISNNTYAFGAIDGRHPFYDFDEKTKMLKIHADEKRKKKKRKRTKLIFVYENRMILPYFCLVARTAHLALSHVIFDGVTSHVSGVNFN